MFVCINRTTIDTFYAMENNGKIVIKNGKKNFNNRFFGMFVCQLSVIVDKCFIIFLILHILCNYVKDSH